MQDKTLEVRPQQTALTWKLVRAYRMGNLINQTFLQAVATFLTVRALIDICGAAAAVFHMMSVLSGYIFMGAGASGLCIVTGNDVLIAGFINNDII